MRFSPQIGGFRAFPNASTEVTARTIETDEVTYKVAYEFDEVGRRKMPLKPRPNRALFLGCSMTLGEGLPAESTFAHQFQSIQSAYRSEILAFHGWSPSILLRLVEQPELAALKASPKGQDIAIFGFIDHHLIRTVAGTALGSSLRLSGQNTNAADGRYLGPFKKVHPWLFIGYSIYLNALKSSILARGIFPELPLYDKDHIDLLANVFLRLKESVNARLGIPDFRVLIFPHSRIGRLLTSRLHDRGIQTINWGAVAIENHVANVYLPYDNHFSAESHRAIAENLKQLLAPTPHPH